MDVTSEWVIKNTLRILDTNPTGVHSPETVKCPECREWWLQALDSINSTDDADTILRNLYEALPEEGHPSKDCTDCDGCEMDIQIGMETVALGLVGVDQMLAWGAGHRGDDEHAWADWEACQSCQQWRYERLEARERLVAAGVDAVRWLGETDDPAKFGN